METINRAAAGVVGGGIIAMVVSFIAMTAILNAGYVPNRAFAVLPLSVVIGMVLMAQRLSSAAYAWRVNLVGAGCAILVSPVLYFAGYAIAEKPYLASGFIAMVIMSLITSLIGLTLIALGFMVKPRM